MKGRSWNSPTGFSSIHTSGLSLNVNLTVARATRSEPWRSLTPTVFAQYCTVGNSRHPEHPRLR